MKGVGNKCAIGVKMKFRENEFEVDGFIFDVKKCFIDEKIEIKSE